MNTTIKMRLYTAVLLAGGLLGVERPLHAQTVRVLGLEEAIDMSLKNSKQLKLSQTRVDLAALEIRQIKENQLPSLGVSASYLRLNTPNIDLRMRQSGNDSTASQGGTPHVNQAMYAMASASMPIFSGFRFKYGLQSAHYLEEAAKLDAISDRDAVIQNTISAYSNLYKAGKAVELVGDNLKHEHERVAEFTNREKNGLLARNDLMKAKLQESNVELALLDAENDLKLTRININLLLGLEQNTTLVADSTSFGVLKEEGLASQWEQLALENRKDISAIGIRQKAADADIRVAKADLYPSVALTAGYVALNIPGIAMIPNAMNAGIGVKYNIASFWKTGARVAQARTAAYQLKTSEEILLDKVHMDVNQAYYNYVLSKRKLEVYTKAIDQAAENYRITRNKFNNNLVTTTELLDADVAQVQSRINFESARADALVFFKKLEQTAGVINR